MTSSVHVQVPRQSSGNLDSAGRSRSLAAVVKEMPLMGLIVMSFALGVLFKTEESTVIDRLPYDSIRQLISPSWVFLISDAFLEW